MLPTHEEIRRRGLVALRRELGRAGMVRFLQQFESGQGDYARERHRWVDEITLEELRVSSAKLKPRSKDRKR
jgi:hypothetical protein